MDMIKFLNKRKKENRQSLIIDNFNVESLHNQLTNTSNSLSTSSDSLEELKTISSNSYQNDTYTNQRDIDYSIRDNMNSTLERNIDKNEYEVDKNEYNKRQNIAYYKDQNIITDVISQQKSSVEENLSSNVDKHKHEKINEILQKNNNISKPPNMDRYDKPIVSGIPESQYYNSTPNSFDRDPPKCQERDEHKCNICYNKSQIKDSFMILTCGHIFHIRCLVDCHYSDANRCGVIDEEFLNSRNCTVCSKQMEMEDILYIHNKFYKNTKEYIIKQDENIEQLDRQMTKLKEELRVCYEYKQKLEHQREKSRQITVTINTMM